MVNFRFHLVSLTAVFLALAAGITIGAGVVDRATVDQIERQLADVAKRREETNAENDRLRADLSRWGDFSKQAGDRLLAGQLTDVPVVVVATSGVDRGLVDGFAGALQTAGAKVDGQLWFTKRWALGEEDARRLAGILDVAPNTAPAELRTAALAAVGTAWSVGDGGVLVTTLVDQGFLEYVEPTTADHLPLAQLPQAGTRFVVVSGDAADVPVADLAVPLVNRLVSSQLQVVAAQPQAPEVDAAASGEKTDKKKPPPAFVEALRADEVVTGRASTVDNLDDYRGRVAAVLAVAGIGRGQTGHYGFGTDRRLVPEAPTP
jgi:hypothetical protein